MATLGVEGSDRARTGKGARSSEVRLLDVVLAVSEAMDLMCPEIAGHHHRVTGIAYAIGREAGLSVPELKDVVLAAALHDSGAFSLRERLATLEFEMRHPHTHAVAGHRLLRTFPLFEPAARLVRHHHVPWEQGRGERWMGEDVARGSHLLHLADRVSVLIRERADLFSQSDAVRAAIDEGAGARFVPELVEAFHRAAGKESFWLDALAHRAGAGLEALFGEVTLSAGELKAFARLFCRLIDYRSRFTATHTSGVAASAWMIARLAGMEEDRAGVVGVAAALHDLGKLGVPVEIIEKERPLTRGERAAVRGHPYHGYRILGKVRGLEDIARWASDHHERLNGSGYPFHRAGDDLPLESRIVAVADVFTALTEERPYRRGLSGRETAAVIARMAADGALDAGIVALVERHRKECDGARKLAQDRAASRYLAFREHQREIPDA